MEYPIGVPAYRANLNSQLTNSPKQFTTILDKSLVGVNNLGVGTITSYLANKTLLDRRMSLDQVTDGTSNTMLYAEGLAYCNGDVYDSINMNSKSDFSYSNGCWNGDPFTCSYQVNRINNWAVGSEAMNWSAGAWTVKTSAIVWDMSAAGTYDATFQGGCWNGIDPPQTNMKTVAMEFQAPYNYYQSCINMPPGCTGYGCDCIPLVNPDQYYVKGNIPAFFKVDSYQIPASLNSSFYSYKSNTLTINPPSPSPSNPVTFQDGNAFSYEAGLGGLNETCLWFAPQSFGGALHVAMADGSVREITPGVSQKSWNAAITPDGNEVIDTDF